MIADETHENGENPPEASVSTPHPLASPTPATSSGPPVEASPTPTKSGSSFDKTTGSLVSFGR